MWKAHQMGFVISEHVKAKMKNHRTSTAATRPSTLPCGGPPPWHSVMRMPWQDQLSEDCDFFAAAVCQSTEFESLAKTPHIHLRLSAKASTKPCDSDPSTYSSLSPQANEITCLLNLPRAKQSWVFSVVAPSL